jgi:hypothetical protein
MQTLPSSLDSTINKKGLHQGGGGEEEEERRYLRRSAFGGRKCKRSLQNAWTMLNDI